MDKIYKDYTVGVSLGGVWTALLNTDDERYGGKGICCCEEVTANRQAWKIRGSGYSKNISSFHVKEYSLSLHLPPLSVMFLKKK